ncbi:serine hydrolase family protein [Ramlibacter sp. AW1]|uniref:Serine hydrolase family protein n=1 Tax=Ramlibacter aurantiacus TaxID=2801330 RepID=A0A936ZRP0_9BURK|nr:alpha/beta hydrolase [Ramlibacter aurantiacus]MBL0421301.1 serine hydrolase family protein [Ramlibacter aurantiacus]
MDAADVLLLPGWHGSGPQHWQTLWERQHGYRRVEQHDWEQPLRGDWVARLQDVVLSRPGPLVLVAHSLACLLVAAWAAASRETLRVRAALLVAPPDPAQLPLHGWSRLSPGPLPFRSLTVASRNDPFCQPGRARMLAAGWGSGFVEAGDAGHLNADSSLGSWPEGHALLQALLKD